MILNNMIIFLFIQAFLCSILHAMEVQDTTNFTIKFNDMVTMEYDLRNEYIQNSFFASAKHFNNNMPLALKLSTGEDINHATKNIILFPLTVLNSTQQIYFFAQQSLETLYFLYHYYDDYLQLADEIKKRVYCHCIVKWFFDNAKNNKYELILEPIENVYKNDPNTFYKLAVSKCYKLCKSYSNREQDFTLNLPTQMLDTENRLYTTLKSFTYMNDESLSAFLQEQSLEELNQLYNDYDSFQINKPVTDIIYLYILLKICQKENCVLYFARYITKHGHLQSESDYIKDAKEKIESAFEKSQEYIYKKKLKVLHSLNENLWDNKNKLSTFERLFLQYIFISKKEQSYCLYISSLNDVYILKTLFKEVLKKVELLRIDLPPLNSFEDINEFRDGIACFPLLKGIYLLNITCDNIYFKNFITSFFYKYEKIRDRWSEYYSYNVTFQPVPVYIGKNVPEDAKQLLLHYKNFLVTSFIKKLVNDFLFGVLAIGTAATCVGAFLAPIGHLLFSTDASYNKTETMIQSVLIVAYAMSAFLEIKPKNCLYYTDYPNKYRYSFAFSVIGLISFYIYHFYYGNALFRAGFKDSLLNSFMILSGIFFVSLSALVGSDMYDEIGNAKDNIKKLFNILKYKQNIFAL